MLNHYEPLLQIPNNYNTKSDVRINLFNKEVVLFLPVTCLYISQYDIRNTDIQHTVYVVYTSIYR